MTEATHRKTQLRLSPNKAQTEKENPCYHLSGVALLPNSYQMITKKGYNIPLVKSDLFLYLALFGIMYYNIFFQKNKVFLKKLQILLNYVLGQITVSSHFLTKIFRNY